MKRFEEGKYRSLELFFIKKGLFHSKRSRSKVIGYVWLENWNEKGFGLKE